MEQYVVEMRNIRKEFLGIVALDDVTLQLRKGEIHALLGENGAGKSTLMSVLFGLYNQEKGEILLNGEKVTIKDPNDANRLGIGMVHQHFQLINKFSVIENIVLGVEPTKRGVINLSDAEKKVLEISKNYGLAVEPRAKIKDITVGMQQWVEILKMLYRDNDILIFDEPTAMLTPQEIKDLLVIMQKLAEEGKSILFISHKLDEIMSICDRVTVLRRGKYIGTVNVKDTTTEELSVMMVGYKIDDTLQLAANESQEKVLEVKNLCVAQKRHGKNVVDDVSFDVFRGEVVGIAGIDGNGQSELAYALTGLGPITAGHIILKGEDITKHSVLKRNNLGISHIPEDRQKDGLILDFNLASNLILKRYRENRFFRRGVIHPKEINAFSERLIDEFDIRQSQGVSTIVRSMSGGNQQKVIVAREIDFDPDLLLAMSPTRGMDVGAIDYIHRQIINQRNNDKGVLLISLDLEEIFKLSDRILVIYNGKIVANLDPKKTTRQEVGLYMSGGNINGK